MDTAAAEWTATDGPEHRPPGRRLGAWCAALLFAAVSVAVGFRAADSDGVTPVPQVLAFLPWLLAPTGLALLLTLLSRWWLGTLWGVVLLGPLAWFIGPYGKVGDPAGRPVADLRVLTSNVEFGQGTGSLVAAVRREKPDIVFVQECEYECDARLKDDLSQDLPHRRAVEGGGSEGSVILSRFPLRPTDGVPGTMGMPGAIADVDGHPVRLQLAHPMPPLPGQVDLWNRELGALRDAATTDPGAPLILAGDFNASQDHAAFRRILDTGLSDAARLDDADRTATWPAVTAPAFGTQIDHVLVSKDFAADRTRVLDLADTDHRAVVTDLTLHSRR
ncbi:endonuclease/exonuclease/phosphatase family protein [Streptomyces caelestis]|uniref:Endonuclease/exonuclease/phosphatase (EEP) superfamily protein YafD n=1 Tax=Streptomyces caelestis TaxID=36816 RepID=A0A7W9H5N9_9ACTN|nr:endonuclease/exonuclease/phosphatase family protein [Streptomyces caelestis]MBB5796188.1 endonuclease/exonuclease/phosphatase (EEP) superfamily protein YafD [Streptomyces caelestis]GGW42899.1 membrane protein [Streptomyces caelestis]